MEVLSIKNIEDIVAKTNYCLHTMGPQMQNKCRKMLGQTQKFTTTIPGVKRTLEVSDARYKSVVQKWQKKFTERAGMKIVPHCIDICKVKVDVAICPGEYEQHCYLGQFYDTGTNPYDNGFAQFMLDNLLYQKEEDLQYISDIVSVASEAVEGQAGSPWRTKSGLFELIWKLYQKGDLTPVPTGEINIDNVCDAVDSMVDAMHRKMKGKPAQLLVTCDTYIKYCRAKYNMHYQSSTVMEDLRRTYSTMPELPLHHSNVTLCPLLSLDEYFPNDAMIMLGRGNTVSLVDGVQDIRQMYAERDKRSICYFGDFKTGLGFICPNEWDIVTNDQVPNPYMIPLPEEELECGTEMVDNPFTVPMNENFGAAA